MSIAINQLLSIMATLRDPEQGCPWDKKQTLTHERNHRKINSPANYRVAEGQRRGGRSRELFTAIIKVSTSLHTLLKVPQVLIFLSLKRSFPYTAEATLIEIWSVKR